jgi:hypothetical protein
MSASPIHHLHDIQIRGTSQATPVVTGALPLILSADPTLTPDEVKPYLHPDHLADARLLRVRGGRGSHQRRDPQLYHHHKAD